MDKTYYMLVTNIKIQEGLPQLLFNNSVIERKSVIKFLGVMLDDKLLFKHHTEYIAGKISKSVGIMYRLRDLLPQPTITSIYYSLVFTYLKYCNLVWGGTSATYLQSLLLMQKKVVRIIYNETYLAHTSKLFHDSAILKINDIFKFNVALFMFKNRNLPLFHNFHQHDTRNRNNLVPVFHRLSQTQRSLSFLGPATWNSLPQNLKEIRSEHTFKRELKKYLILGYAT